MYFGCQCSSARCSRLLLDRLTLFGIFSAEIIYASSSRLQRFTKDTEECPQPLCPLFAFVSFVSAREFSRALPVELRPSLLPIYLQRAFVADGVRPLEDPVLPRRQASEDLRLHRLGPGESQVRFEARHGIGRKRCACFDGEPHLVVPVDLVRRERDEAGLFRLRGVERL